MATKPRTTTATTTAVAVPGPAVLGTTPGATPAPTYAATTGTRTAPATTYRALRQAKGYGRVALAQALGVGTAAVWALENHTHGPAYTAALRTLQALPNVGRAAAHPAPALPATAPGMAPGYPYTTPGRTMPGAVAWPANGYAGK